MVIVTTISSNFNTFTKVVC